jgi:hypothetical protein
MYFGGDMLTRANDNLPKLDTEWIQLMMEAKMIGMEISVIRDFLKEKNEKD